MSHVLTHGCSLSNLPLFVADALGLFQARGVAVQLARVEDMATTAALLRSGRAELGTAPFIQPLVDAVSERPPVLVAGSGLRGIALLARPGLSTTDLAGRRVGTFRGDPMELLLHDVLASSAVRDVEIVQLATIEEALEQFRDGSLAAVTLAQPHVDRLLGEGAELLSDGRAEWGEEYPDTVLVASARLVREEPDTVRAVIAAMLDAEVVIAADPLAAVARAQQYFGGFTPPELAAALLSQPTRIDIRSLVPTVFGRWATLKALGLVALDRELPVGALDLTALTDLVEHGGAPDHHPTVLEGTP